MSFIITDKQPGGGSGTFANGYQGEAKEIWTVIASDINHSTEDLRASGIFPQPYQSVHAQNPWLILMPIEIDQDEEAPDKFTCTLTWTSTPLKKEEEDRDTEADPLAREALWSWSTGRDRVALLMDLNGDAIVNSANEGFDPTPERDQPFLIAHGVKKVAGVPDWAWDMIDTVNVTDFVVDGRTVPKGCATLADIQLSEWLKAGDTRYREATFELHVKKKRLPRTGESVDDIPSPWQLEIIDQGLHELDTATGELIRILDDATDPQPIAQPVLLDGLGFRLTTPEDKTTHFYWQYQIRDESDFNNLPLA